MSDLQKIRMIERGLFFILVIAMGMGGFFYEVYKEEVSGSLLVFFIISYFFVCYAIYQGLLRLSVKIFAPHE